MLTLQKFRDEAYLPSRIFTILSFFFLAGIMLANFLKLNFPVDWPIFIFAMLTLLFVAFINYMFGNRPLVLISFGFVALVFALLFYSYFESKTDRNLPFGSEIEIEGKIVKRPDIDYKAQKIVLETSSINGQKSNILITLPHFPAYEYGDELKIKGKIEEPQVFDDFDYKSYLRRYLIFGVIQKPKEITFEASSRRWSDKTIRSLYNFSSLIEQSLNRLLPEPHASLAAGLILGVKKNMPDDFQAALKNTGLTHIIALSGYNVTIIIAALSAILLTNIGRRRTFWVGTSFVIVFVLLTGASPSVIRAAIFSLLILFGRTIGRQGDETNLLLLAALTMILFNPYVLLYDVGFQLSFLAFAGLIYISPMLKKLFEKKIVNKIPEYIKLPLIETLSAQIAVLPILIFTFRQASIIAPLANILVLWTLPYAMLFALLASVFGLIYLPLGQLLGGLLWIILQYIILIVNYLSAVPFSSIKF